MGSECALLCKLGLSRLQLQHILLRIHCVVLEYWTAGQIYTMHVMTHQLSVLFQHQIAGRALCAAARSHCKREFSLSDRE